VGVIFIYVVNAMHVKVVIQEHQHHYQQLHLLLRHHHHLDHKHFDLTLYVPITITIFVTVVLE
jgi:hypothetical protein